MRAEGKETEVLEILIGSVQSQQNRTAKPTYFMPSSRTMAQSALARVGCGEVAISAYDGHAVQDFALSLAPRSISNRFVINLLKPQVGKTERKR